MTGLEYTVKAEEDQSGARVLDASGEKMHAMLERICSDFRAEGCHSGVDL